MERDLLGSMKDTGPRASGMIGRAWFMVRRLRTLLEVSPDLRRLACGRKFP